MPFIRKRLIINLFFLAISIGTAGYLARSVAIRDSAPSGAADVTNALPTPIRVDDLIVTDEQRKSILRPEQEMQLLSKKKQPVTIVDLREREKYAKGHIPSSINIPLDELEVRAEEEIPVSRFVVLAYCECDKENKIALAFRSTLIGWGYQNVAVMNEGVDGWQRASFTLVEQK